jgi:hypothetical protein
MHTNLSTCGISSFPGTVAWQQDMVLEQAYTEEQEDAGELQTFMEMLEGAAGSPVKFLATMMATQ